MISRAQRFNWFAFTALLSFAVAACGNEVLQPVPIEEGGGAGAGATGGGGGSGGTGGEVGPLDIEQLTAPDEYTVRVQLTSASSAEGALSAPQSFQISEPLGPLEVTAAAYDPNQHLVTLTTAKQKLGVSYQLIIAAVGEDVDGLGGTFLSADTASFWASDFSDPNYADYLVVADRVEVGEHAVVYVQQGESSFGAASAVQYFDEQTFPIETALFTTPTDIDENGKVVLLGLDGQWWYGGYFSPVNTLTEEEAQQWGIHSNEMEMLYINVTADAFSGGHVVAHEFSHLLYHSRHGLTMEYWAYQNEGLAECAVHAVEGSNPYAADTYFLDPNGAIGAGMSLVNWQDGVYDQYAFAYVFWTYLASRLGGVQGYGDIFDVFGSPENIDAFIQQELGSSFGELQRDMMVATWVKAPTGPAGFEGMLSVGGAQPPTVAAGQTSVNLEPFAGTFFKLAGDTIDYPGDQGADILYAGIDGSGNVDLTAPFDISGGALVVLNTSFDYSGFTPQPSGPNQPALSPLGSLQGATLKAAVRDPAWKHPPPLHPSNRGALNRWRERTRLSDEIATP